jgi:hypothetical protein
LAWAACFLVVWAAFASLLPLSAWDRYLPALGELLKRFLPAFVVVAVITVSQRTRNYGGKGQSTVLLVSLLSLEFGYGFGA